MFRVWARWVIIDSDRRRSIEEFKIHGEKTLSSYLSLLLSEYDGVSYTAEKSPSGEPIDITVTHQDLPKPVPILVEATIGTTPAKRRAVAQKARSRLTKCPRALAFAVCYPAIPRETAFDTVGFKSTLASCGLEFASVQRVGRATTWHEGSIADLASSLRNTDLSQERIGDAIEYTVREAAKSMLKSGSAPMLANALVLPKSTARDLRATSLIGSLILSNAAIIHHRLRLAPALSEVQTLEDALKEPGQSVRILRSAWRKILEIDYQSIFLPASAALEALPTSVGLGILHRLGENAVSLADELASLRFDHAGPLYHRLLESARFDGSFYTNNVAALLLAQLALPTVSADWSDADALGNLRIIDPACGTGTLLMATMHAVSDLHQRSAAFAATTKGLHRVLVEQVLYGLDINRHGVQLAACNLTLGNPHVDFTRMNLYTMQHGPQWDGSTKAGSLELLATAKNARDVASLTFPLPTISGLRARRAEPGTVSAESLAGKFGLVIMNPPFTRNDIRNRQYDLGHRRLVQFRELEIAGFVRDVDQSAFNAIDQTSIGTFFSPLADLLLKDSRSTLARVAPTTALTSVSGKSEREFLAARFQIETVVTSHDPKHVSFSENTAIHESLIVARRPGSEHLPTRFISLARMPRTAREATLLSDLINREAPLRDWGTEHRWPWRRVRDGDWTAALFYDPALAVAARDLAALAGKALRTAGKLCRIEPEGRRVRDAFVRDAASDAPWRAPVLWEHPTDRQVAMHATADVQATPKPDKERYARTILLKQASRLLIVNRAYTHQIRVAACYADEPLLGSAWTPVASRALSPRYEKALCAWWNSTPGILTLLHARARKLTYPRYALTSLRSLLVPDPQAVEVGPLANAFKKCRTSTLLPWPQMVDCPTRAILDAAAAQVLGIDVDTIARWRSLIAREPTVSGRPA